MVLRHRISICKKDSFRPLLYYHTQKSQNASRPINVKAKTKKLLREKNIKKFWENLWDLWLGKDFFRYNIIYNTKLTKSIHLKINKLDLVEI